MKRGEQNKPETNHVSTRVDLELKRRGLEYSRAADRSPSWVWAKAIEMGLTEVIRRYPPAPKRSKASVSV